MNHPFLKYKNLEEVMNAVGGPVSLLRTSTIGGYVFPVVPPEYTNWRDEQRAWKNSVALSNLSYHMTSLYLKGPDVLKLLKRVGCNKFGTFPPNRGKQILLSSHDGYFITDGICFHTEDDVYRIVGSPVVINWIQFNAETAGYDVEAERDEGIHFRGGDPQLYIYQIQGPHALDLMKDVSAGRLTDLSFFHIGETKIKGKSVRVLRHGMAGVPGYELFGPWADAGVILDTLEAAGEKYQLRKIGAAAYPTTCLESGWLPFPCPPIYHSQAMKPYREWLTPMNLEVLGSMGGSLESDNIVDYYVDPIEVGYGPHLDLNSDCIGRDALAEKIKNPQRRKVTLVWNQDDVAQTMQSSLFKAEQSAKFMNLPLCVYSTFQYDEVTKNGRRAGVSQYVGASTNANAILSLAIVDIGLSEPGTEVTVRWGEPNSRRPVVEKHTIREIRAKVAPAPFFERTNKV
jgi:vanillate/3-O-methylgallate O-demethylase